MRQLFMTAALSACVLGCGDDVEPPPGWLDQLASGARPSQGSNWPVPPEQALESISGPIELLSMQPTEAGTTGAFRAQVLIGGRELTAKWKPVRDASADSFNNTPRKEIAAFEVQKWFLDPEDWLVPPVQLHCLPLDAVRRYDPRAVAQLPQADCQLGAVSLWLDDLVAPEPLFDEARFYAEPHYAWHMANFNLFAYVTKHRDAATHNVLTSRDPSNRRVFAIDNGMSFGGVIHNVFAHNWNVIRVPALRRDAVERLRGVSDADIDALAVVVLFGRTEQGLQAVGPEDSGGEIILSLGLTEAERSGIRRRIDDLLARVDAGAIPLF